MSTPVETTVIGSYPPQISTSQLMQSYFNQSPPTWKPVIDAAVNDMLSAGIMIISDGQTRDPFVEIFTRKLTGCRIRDRTEITGKITYDTPITVPDITYIKNQLPKHTKLLGLLTGPYTLAQSCNDMYYHNTEQLAFDFAHALHHEAQHLEKHVDLLSVDEPFFSTDLPAYAHELIDIVYDGIKLTKRLHVCGNVSGIIPTLLDMPVDILSHEFKTSPQLFDAFKDYAITKKICLGCVRSDTTAIESIQEITQHIKKAQTVFEDNIAQLAPDCGQRMLPQPVALQKLKNLVKAGESINAR